jgi:hypothetical protein
MIGELIDKRDGYEIVREQVAAILATELRNQRALAEASGRDPSGWAAEVYVERSNPLDVAEPSINVWAERVDYQGRAGGAVETQKGELILNVDCVGFGVSQDDMAGHLSGDQVAAVEAQRLVRLCRNILMSAHYTYLGMRDIVRHRWVQGITFYQPSSGAGAVEHAVGGRLALRIEYVEQAPQVQGTALESVRVVVGGKVQIEAIYQ